MGDRSDGQRPVTARGWWRSAGVSLAWAGMLLAIGPRPATGGSGRDPMPPPSQHLPQDFQPQAVMAALRQHLDQEVLPFWTAPRIVDPEYGGFLPWFDADGRPTGLDEPKALITQLRVLFAHVIAIQRTEDDAERERIRRQYDQGFAFLLGRFRDPAGGWVFEVARNGRATNREKPAVGQAYVIYVMAEAHRRISDSRARRIALETFAWMDEHGHDAQHGGYLERCDLPPNAPANRRKSVGANMHAALALARLFQIAPSKQLRQRLEELLDLLTTRAVAPSGCAYVATTRDWRPARAEGGRDRQTLYGHNAELAWYVQDVARALGHDPRRLAGWAQRMATALIRWGLARDGSVRTWGPLRGRPRTDDEVAWWPQAEAMILLLRMYEWTGDRGYWDAFEHVCRFAFGHLVVDRSGAWLGGLNRRTGERYPRGGWGWKSGLHVIRMLLECERSLMELQRPRPAYHPPRGRPRRAVQLEPGFAYLRGRSAASIVSEVKANGFDCIHLICSTDTVQPPDLVAEARRQGVEIWGTFFPTGIYMPAELFGPDHTRWLMQFTTGQFGGYRFFSYVHRDYQEWWKRHLARLFERYPFDGMLFYEVHYPTSLGPTQWGDTPTFGDVSPGFVRALRRATGHAAFPNFTDPGHPDYYRTNRTLYEDYVEYRVQSIVDFHREVLDGEGGFRRRFPRVMFATWTISLAHPQGPAAMRENEAQDPARLVAELHPDAHILQSHYPDWLPREQRPDYVRGYAPYVDAVRGPFPNVPLGLQADVCSTTDYRRSPEWMAAMEQTARQMGLTITTYYEFGLRWEVYHAPPRAVSGRLDRHGNAVIVFDQRIAPGSAAALIGTTTADSPERGRTIREVRVDGNLLHLRVPGPLRRGTRVTVPLGGIASDPTVRFPMPGKGQGEAHAIAQGATIRLVAR